MCQWSDDTKHLCEILGVPPLAPRHATRRAEPIDVVWCGVAVSFYDYIHIYAFHVLIAQAKLFLDHKTLYYDVRSRPPRAFLRLTYLVLGCIQG